MPTAGHAHGHWHDDPEPGGYGHFQLLTGGVNNPDALNYYFDNGSPPGETFVTGSDPDGYTLTSLSVFNSGNDGGLPAGGQAYVLRLYSVSGNAATLYATYTSQTNFTFISGDWLRWSGLTVPLANNTTYAYTLPKWPAAVAGATLAMSAATLTRMAKSC